MTHGDEAVRAELVQGIDRLRAAAEGLAETASAASAFLEGVAARVRAGDPIVELVSDPAALELREATYEATGLFMEAMAEVRGMFYRAAVSAGASLTDLERRTGIRRQTIAGLIQRLRRRPER